MRTVSFTADDNENVPDSKSRFSGCRQHQQRMNFATGSSYDRGRDSARQYGGLGRTPTKLPGSYYRKQLERTPLSEASTAGTLVDPLTETQQRTEFVRTQHLGSDAFPQFPSSRRSPSTPVFSPTTDLAIDTTRHQLAESYPSQVIRQSCKKFAIHSDEEVNHPRQYEVRQSGSLYDVGCKLALLVREILLEYKYFWLSLIAFAFGLRLLLYIFRYALMAALLLLSGLFVWNAVKTMFACTFASTLPKKIERKVSTVATAGQQRWRDLPATLLSDQPQFSAPAFPSSGQVKLPQQPQRVPSWLRWYPVGNFGEADVPISAFRTVKTFTAPATLLQKERQLGVGGVAYKWDVLSSDEINLMTRKLNSLITELCNRLIATEAQDAALSSALAELGLHYVVEHPLIAFYSLDVNDNNVVNLSDRHTPQILLQLCNSVQERERQIGSQLLQLLLQRRQLEKYLMIVSGEQRKALLRRLSRWLYGGLEKEFEVYSPALTNPIMTDGDILHYLLFTFLAQQLPSIQTDVLSRTFLSVHPKQSQRQSASWTQPPSPLPPALSIQKLPTETPSSQGTFYKITRGSVAPATKLTILEVSWDDNFGIFKGIAIFLLYLKRLRFDIELQASPDLMRLLEDC